MELQTFAQITGILVLLIGLPLLISGEATAAFIQELMRNMVFLRVMGAVIIVISALTLKQGYRIGTDPAGLIRIVAWIGLIKGVTAAWYPGVLIKLSQRVFDDAGMRPVLAIVAIAIGGILLYGAQII